MFRSWNKCSRNALEKCADSNDAHLESGEYEEDYDRLKSKLLGLSGQPTVHVNCVAFSLR